MKKLTGIIIAILFCAISAHSQVLAPNGIRVGKRTSSKVGIIDSIPTYGGKIRFYRGGILLSPVTADSLKSTDYLTFIADTVYRKPNTHVTQYQWKNAVVQGVNERVLKYYGADNILMESAIPLVSNSTFTLVKSRLFCVLQTVTDTTRINGFRAYQTTQGSYTGDTTTMYNGFILFRVSNDTAYKVIQTPNDLTVWSAVTAGNMVQKALRSPLTIKPGKYALALVYNNTAQTTAPVMAGITSYQVALNPLSNGWYAGIEFGSIVTSPAFLKSASLYKISVSVPLIKPY